MKMHLLSGGRVRMRKSIFLPDAERDATIELPVCCALLRHGAGNVLFDTGCHPAVATEPQARWGGLAKSDDADHAARRQCRERARQHRTAMRRRRRGGVFASASRPLRLQQLLQARQFHHPCRGSRSGARAGAAASGYLAAEWEQGAPTDMLDGERDLFGDGRIVLIPLPGHTPGTTGALVALDSAGTFFWLPIPSACAAHSIAASSRKNTWNAEALVKSLAEVRRIEAGGAKVLCGHDDVQ